MSDNKQFWFVVGSQFLYGPEVLETVAARAAGQTSGFDAGRYRSTPPR